MGTLLLVNLLDLLLVLVFVLVLFTVLVVGSGGDGLVLVLGSDEDELESLRGVVELTRGVEGGAGLLLVEVVV